MNRTNIHTTKKLEKLITKLISKDQNPGSGKLGKWNATIFYVDKKKIWLLTNGRTKYNVIMVDIKAADLPNIASIFKLAFYKQLNYDGITVSCERLDTLIGELRFLPTDNDRSTTAFQNQRLYELSLWKHTLKSLERMPLKELINRMNDAPIRIANSKKKYDYTDSIREMKRILME